MPHLLYVAVQVLHNLGAVAVLGLSGAGAWHAQDPTARHRILAMWLALAWATQLLIGGAYGAAGFYFDGHYPAVHGIALAALSVKVLTAIAGFILATLFWLYRASGPMASPRSAWLISLALGTVAVAASLAMHWFS